MGMGMSLGMGILCFAACPPGCLYCRVVGKSTGDAKPLYGQNTAVLYGYGNVFGNGDSVSCCGYGQHDIWGRDGMATEPCGISVGYFLRGQSVKLWVYGLPE